MPAKQKKADKKVTLTLPDGTRKYFYGRTKKEAEQKRDEAKRQIAGGIDVGNNMTFKELADIWLREYMAKKKLHECTKASTKGIFDRYLLPELGHMKLRDIKPAHIDLMLLKYADLSKSTQSKILIYAGAVFDKAIENGIIPRSPTFNKKPTADDPEEVKPLTNVQCEELLKTMKGTRVYPFIVLVLFSGLRKGEALGLMWKDLDFENRLIHVRRSVIYPEGSKRHGEICDKLKSDSAHRTIPMAPEIYNVMMAEKKKTDSVYVFSMRNGSFLTQESFRSMWDLIRYRTIGGPATGHHVHATLDFSVHPHQLRHTCCTRWIANGMTPKEAQYLMGHSSPDITMGIYADYIAEQELSNTAKKLSSDGLRLALG
ncbi:MAG: site-specific integrase [Oscillospiraceae bacterium]|nr:site-specific integrase [Oscillospiraceae bacterium]